MGLFVSVVNFNVLKSVYDVIFKHSPSKHGFSMLNVSDNSRNHCDLNRLHERDQNLRFTFFSVAFLCRVKFHPKLSSFISSCQNFLLLTEKAFNLMNISMSDISHLCCVCVIHFFLFWCCQPLILSQFQDSPFWHSHMNTKKEKKMSQLFTNQTVKIVKTDDIRHNTWVTISCKLLFISFKWLRYANTFRILTHSNKFAWCFVKEKGVENSREGQYCDIGKFLLLLVYVNLWMFCNLVMASKKVYPFCFFLLT